MVLNVTEFIWKTTKTQSHGLQVCALPPSPIPGWEKVPYFYLQHPTSQCALQRLHENMSCFSGMK